MDWENVHIYSHVLNDFWRWVELTLHRLKLDVLGRQPFLFAYAKLYLSADIDLDMAN